MLSGTKMTAIPPSYASVPMANWSASVKTDGYHQTRGKPYRTVWLAEHLV